MGEPLKKLFIFIFVSYFSLTVLVAEEKYQNLLNEFKAFGLPDISKATYVKVSHTYYRGMSDFMDSNFTSDGNAWLLGSKDDKLFNFVVSGNTLATFSRRNIGDRYSHQTAVWRESSVDTDIKRAIRFINKRLSKDDYDFKQKQQRLFFFALNLMQRGHKVEAGKILDLIYSEKLIRSSINNFATEQYSEALKKFSQRPNFSLLLADLNILLARYNAKKWRIRPAIELLCKQIIAHLKDDTETLPIMKKLSNADQALAKALLSSDGRIDYFTKNKGAGESVIWLIPETWIPLFPNYQKDPILNILSRGLASVPLLLTLYEDKKTRTNYLPFYKQEAPLFENEDNDSLFDTQTIKPQTMLKDLRQPLTYSELSLFLLKRMFPKRNFVQNYDPVALAKALYKKYSKGTTAELAVSLKNKCLQYQFEEIAKLYIKHKAEKRPNKAYEKIISTESGWKKKDDLDALFSSDHYDARKFYEAAFEYLQLRQDKVLAQKVAKHCEKFGANYNKPLGHSYGSKEATDKHVKETKKWFKKLAAQIRDIRPRNFEATVKQYLDGEINRYNMSIFISSTDELKQFLEILNHEATTNYNGVRCMRGLKSIASIRYSRSQYPFISCPPAPDYKEFWKQLISDNSRPDKSDFTTSELTLIAMEALYAKKAIFPRADRYYGHNDPRTFLKKYVTKYKHLATDLLKKRAFERINGFEEDKLTPFPFEGKVVVNKEEIVTVFNKFGIDSIDQLDIYQCAALTETLLEHPKLNRKLLLSANKLVKINIEVDDSKLKEKFEIWKSKPVTVEFIKLMRAVCKSYAITGKKINLLLKRNKNLKGSELTIREESTGCLDSPADGYSGSVVAFNIYQSVTHRTTLPSDKKQRHKVKTSSNTDMKSFDTAIYDYIHNSAASSMGLVHFMTKEDSK